MHSKLNDNEEVTVDLENIEVPDINELPLSNNNDIDDIPISLDIPDTVIGEPIPIVDDMKYINTYTVGDLTKLNYLYPAPVSNYHQLVKFTSTVNKDVNMQAIQNRKSNKDNDLYYSSIINTINGNSKVIADDPYRNYFSKGIFANAMEFGNKLIAPKKLSINSKKGNGAMIAKISKSLASGENVQMPLWNSGFWITIKPPTSTDLTILKRDLDKNRLKLGRETGGLLYSNKTITLYKIVVDFILSKCINTTIQLEEDDDIRDYIFVDDIPLMVLTVAIALYPNGFKTTIGCANNAVFDETTKEVKCSFLETATMDLDTLLRIDYKRIDTFMLETMANRQPGSVSKIRVEEYRNRITKHNKDYNTVSVVTESGDDIVITYDSPDLTKYFYKGQFWVDSIIKKIETLIFDDADDKDEIIDDLVTTSILGIYSAFVSTILYDGELMEDEDAKLEVLSLLSSDDDIYSGFFAGVKKFLGSTPIAVVATTNFICPTCSLERKPKSGDCNWDDYIVLDPLNYFLDLIELRLRYKMRR